MGKLKFGSSKSEFGLRSGNKSSLPFKQMGSSVAKHTTDKTHFHSGERQDTTDIVADPKIAEVPSKTQDEIKNDQTQQGLDIKQGLLDLAKQKYADKTSTKKTGPNIEQQLADKKVSDLQQKKSDLLTKSKEKGWSAKKFNRKEKRLNKKIGKAEKMQDPLNRAEHDLKEARWLDAAAQDPTQTQQNLVKARHRDSQVNQDLETVKKVENQEELPNPQTVDPDSYITASTGESRTGSEIMGEIETPDYSTWSDEDLEKRRTDPTYRPS